MTKINSYNEGQSPAHQIKLVHMIKFTTLLTYFLIRIVFIYVCILLCKTSMFYLICGGPNSWMDRWTIKVLYECTCVSHDPSMCRLASHVTRGTVS